MPLSYATPKIVRNGRSRGRETGIDELKNVTCSLLLYSLLHDVISASVVLLVETLSLSVKIQFSNSYEYVYCCLAVVSCLGCS